MAEYATASGIAEHPAFAWWVPYVLRKRNVIASAVNSRICKCSHKYGIKVPCSVKEALDFDCKNGNTFWVDALTKEMGKVCVAFEILGPNDNPPVGWYKASGHIDFDVKMDFSAIRHNRVFLARADAHRAGSGPPSRQMRQLKKIHVARAQA